MPSLKTTCVALLATVRTLVLAWPQPPIHARILETQVNVRDEYDYIIVGGGTSGLTVGDRLTENGKYSVLVIESGLYHNETGMDPSRMFNITSEPSPGLNDRQFFVGIGRSVGGSSTVNGQVMLRGTKEEYDAWRELGGPGSTWDWEGLFPYFKKGLTLTHPNPEIAKEFKIKHNKNYWGTDTPIYVTYGPNKPPNFFKALYSAMASIPGMKIAEDSGSGENGLYWYASSQDPQTYKRSYSRTGHWDDVRRDNYDMVVGAKVKQILLDDSLTATGVRFASVNDTGPAPISVSARREVILAAGSIHTPQVLMLSGIGPRPLLDSAGIDVRVDLPGVGSNFQDHSYIPSIGYEWGNEPPGYGDWPGVNFSPNLVATLGLPVLAPDNYGALASKYEKQDPESHLPSSYTSEQIEGYRRQQALYSQLMRSSNTSFNEMMMFGPGGSIQNLHCASRGTVLLDPKDPEGEVRVDYRAASNEIDLEVMAENIRFMRRYMAARELARYEPRETGPGLNYSTTAQLIDWSRDNVIPSVFHPVGTCAKMPRDLGGCLDEQLLVFGAKNLSVVDASMMPTTVGATTSSAVYAVAEKAADMIKERTYDSSDV